MIFVTVGTDHHQFTRLLQEINTLVKSGDIDEEVVVQYGLNRFVPDCAKAEKFLSFDAMLEYIKNAHIVITHASSTAMLSAIEGKVPIVVPRRNKFREAIDDHQADFARQIKGLLPWIIIEDCAALSNTIKQYDKLVIETLSTALPRNGNHLSAVNELNNLLDRWF